MGNVRVSEMLEGGWPTETVLSDHLRHNIYPPVPDLTALASEAIDAVALGHADTCLRLPNGANVTAQDIVDGLHLGEFLEHRRCGL